MGTQREGGVYYLDLTASTGIWLLYHSSWPLWRGAARRTSRNRDQRRRCSADCWTAPTRVCPKLCQPFCSVCRLYYFILYSFNCCCCFWFTLRIWHRVCVFFLYILVFFVVVFLSLLCVARAQEQQRKHLCRFLVVSVSVSVSVSVFCSSCCFVVFIVLIYCALQFACLVYSSSSSCERQRSSRSSNSSSSGSTWI